jgi:hypothetical protein
MTPRYLQLGSFSSSCITGVLFSEHELVWRNQPLLALNDQIDWTISPEPGEKATRGFVEVSCSLRPLS